MKNSLVLLAVVLSVAAFAGMMRIKTDVQTMDRTRMKLVQERSELRETKRVLEAEWALLASPSRMEHVVQGMGYVPANALDVVRFKPAVSPTAPSPTFPALSAPVVAPAAASPTEADVVSPTV